jgi:glycosyltransferase involved in cell wall biosynthesis
MTVDFSVVVPVRNGEATLVGCLQALRTQTLPDEGYEVIVVDDGSTDASARIAEPLVDLVIPRPGIGAAAARNAGWQAARGRWIAFTDADCVPSCGWLAALATALTGERGHALGAAGRTIGYRSDSPAARFVDLT